MQRGGTIRRTIGRLGYIFILFVLVFSCSRKKEQSVVLIIHQFQLPYSRTLFESGVTKTADSLNVPIALFSCTEFSDLPETVVDSLIDISQAVAVSCLDSSIIATVLQQKNETAPLLGFDQRLSVQYTLYIDTDPYTAGKQAGDYIKSQFGNSGTFAIITPSLENERSNECIRGFRERLGIAKNRWKQLNILTCNSPNYIISTQFRRLSGLQPKPVWLVAGACENFLNSIREDKGDNYFLTMALDLENQQLLDHSMFDALAVKDYYRMGEMIIENGIKLKSEPTPAVRNLNCGVRIISSKELAPFN